MAITHLFIHPQPLTHEPQVMSNENPNDAKPVLAAGFYRCGWCGQPTNKEAQPLTIDECKQLTDKQLNSAELLYGNCCSPQQEREKMIVTRDMAIDAGDLSLEGQRWVW